MIFYTDSEEKLYYKNMYLQMKKLLNTFNEVVEHNPKLKKMFNEEIEKMKQERKK